MAGIKVVRPFKIRLQRIHSRESEGWGMGENDIHFYVTIKNGSQILYSQRHPSSGDYGDHNIINPNITFPELITPNKINMRISFSIDIRDSDPGNDYNLGKHTTVLSASNAWGFNQPNFVFNQSFSKIQSLLWSIRPEIDIASLTEKERWWSFDNFKTPAISKNQYAAAFRDVDSETEWWDIDDGLKNLYYNWVVKGVASGGNCFGMSLEAIYARKNNSLLNEPLQDVRQNGTVENEINIKHEYQVGARPIWWFVGQFLTGNTHDPKDVFNATRNAFNRGDNPVLCVSQNYDFSGSPHCIMPYKWDSSGSTWKMSVMDPNKASNDSMVVNVDSNNNTFQYNGSKRYSGGAWSGGRMHYMPYCVLDTMQRTPVWDAIMLLLSGTILILADDAETVSIQDENGKDLDANGTRAQQVLKSGGKPEEFFVSFTGYDTGSSIKPGQIMMRKDKFVSSVTNIFDRVNVTALPLGTLAGNNRIQSFTTRSLPSNTSLRNLVINRSAHHILSDQATSGRLSDSLKNNLKELLKVNNKRNFRHTIRGATNGKLEYCVKSEQTAVKIESTISRNEVNTILMKDLNTNAYSIDFKSPKNKTMSIQVTNKLGVNGDFINLSVNNIPVQAEKSIAFNVKAGLTGIEIENQGVNANLPVKVKGFVDGQKIDKDFNMPFDQAMRIKPSTMVNTDELLVSKISNLFGTIRSSQILDKI